MTDQSLSPRDYDWIDKLSDDLPYAKDIRFLEEHSFGAGFSWRSLDRLANFVHGWGRDVHYEFNHPDLERLRSNLHAAAEEFLHELAMNTFIEPGSHSTDRWARVSDALELRDRATWEALVARLDALADEVVSAYKELVREGARLRS